MVDGRDLGITDEQLARLVAAGRGFDSGHASGVEDERERVLALIDQQRKRIAITPRGVGWDRALVTLKKLIEDGDA